MDDLEERLKRHAKAFEGLMSLIPAKQYYGEDTSDQWQRKKQTKEQKREARRAKLNPENQKSAKDVMDENERKRKREQDDGAPDSADIALKEQSLEGSKVKKQKLVSDSQAKPNASVGAENDAPDGDSSTRQTKAQKRREKRERQKEKKVKQQEKAQAKKERKKAAEPAEPADPVSVPDKLDSVQEEDVGDWEDIDDVDVSGMAEDDTQVHSSATPSPAPESPASHTSAQPSTSSTSSIVPPKATEESESLPKKFKLPQMEHDVLQAKLRARIDALRAARKADGVDGKPARNRQELLEARRRKAEQRKAAKKESRKQAKEDEQRAKAEAELARLRGSSSPMSTPGIFSPRSPPEPSNLSFSRVTFDDGEQLDSSLTTLVDPSRNKKGRQDPKAALEAAKKKQARIAGFDDAKRADVQSKEAWLNAKKKAHGERVRDDTSLLKKALKRQEKQKSKSEKEWNSRIEGVRKGKEARQRKREENLAKRRDEKNNKRKKVKGKPKVAKKAKGRPGFEGSFRAKARDL